MAKRESKLSSKIPIDMTPMIDVVFQLLTFFMLTMKTVLVEGDFNIRMPMGASAGTADNPMPPIIVKMTATPDGALSDVRLGGKSVVGRDILDAAATADAMLAAAGPGNREQIIAARKAKDQATAQLTAVLQQAILQTIDRTQAAAVELELDCDPGLKYGYVMNAITAASGEVQGDQIVPLIQKIKFTPPKKAK